MIGIIISAQGKLAGVLKENCESNKGLVDHLIAVNGMNDSVEQIKERLEKAVLEMNKDCQDILFLVDSYKSNACKAADELSDSYAKQIRMEVLSGVNSGMIDEILDARSFIKELDTMCKFAVDTGKRYVIWTTSNDRNSPLLVREEEE